MSKSTALKVVVAGHICLDIIPSVSSAISAGGNDLMPGALVEVGPAQFSTGGAVANTGVALHKLGIPVKLLAKTGGDLFGDAIRNLLESQGKGVSECIKVIPGEHSSYTIVWSPPGIDRTFLHCRGANDTFVSADITDSDLQNMSIFHFGYPPLMERMSVDNGEELRCLFVRAKENGAATSLDMAKPDPRNSSGQKDWEAFMHHVLPVVDVFMPSWDEIAFMLSLGKSTVVPDGALLDQAARTLLAMGPSIVGLKLGENGLYVRTTGDPEKLAALEKSFPLQSTKWRNRELLTPCYQVEVAGTTGSGDCTIAGFIAGLYHEQSPEECVNSAVGTGACNVERVDATSGIPTWPELQNRIGYGWAKGETAIRYNGSFWMKDAQMYRGPHDRT